jgi:peroxiredoxin
MKKLLVLGFAICFALSLTSCEKKSENKKVDSFHYSISLDVANLRGPVILLDRTTNEPVKTIYSRTPEFTMEGELPLDKMHASFVLHFPSKYSNPYFYPVKDACAIDFYMDKETVIKAHYDSLLFADVNNDHMSKVEQFKRTNFPAVVEFEKFNKQSLKESDGERRSEEEQIAYANKGNALLDAVRKEVIHKAGNYSDREEMAVLLANWGGQIGLEKLDSLGALFQPSVKETAAYKRVVGVSDYMKRQQAPQSLEAGQMAPKFTLKDAEGKEHSLADFKGKYLVIDFWASWCGPCKKEMPFMKELYEKYHAKGLEMLAISTDNDRNAWLKAMKKLNMPYLQLHDKNGDVAANYFVRGIPYVLFISPKGDIIAIQRGEALEALIKKELKA